MGIRYTLLDPVLFVNIYLDRIEIDIGSGYVSRAFGDYLKLVGIKHIEALGNVTPADVYYDRKDDILARRKEVKRKTLQTRYEHNRKLSELDKANLTG